MKVAALIEDRRIEVQATLDAEKSQADRNKLGQFATPAALASEILAYACKLVPPGKAVRFLDPALGTGSFYSALLREFKDSRIEAALGFEIDPHYGKAVRDLWSGHPLETIESDFTTTPPEGRSKFNLLICNPPYVRHHHIDKTTKARLRAATTAACGVQMAGLAGLYCYFLGLAHAWLEPDAISGWLIPSQFMDVNYGVPIKQYLAKHVELIRIHRFDPKDLQFGDALVSSAVVWFRNKRPQAGHQAEFSFGGTLAKPKISRAIAIDDIPVKSKWTGVAVHGAQPFDSRWRLADFFEIRRGLATGDNGFFIMARDEIAARNLPLEFFKPILPGPRYLETDLVEAEEDGAPKIERQLFMLDCRLPEPELEWRYPALWSYLQTGKPKVAETYLCSRRSPWYAQEHRPPPPFICTYMGRNITTRGKPFRFILNLSQATAANVYLLIYPKPVVANALINKPALARRIWEFLNEIDASALLGESRVYGGGLYKLEPKELANVPAAKIAALLSIEESGPSQQGEVLAEREVA